MARRGRQISGWLVVDKPAGATSTTVTGIVRRALGAAKAGHAGTLDPDATGVLAVALGEATKTVPQATGGLKTYDFRIRLGAETETDDAAGKIVATSALRPSDEAIRAALSAFRGDILQVPPAVSAVKVDGARAYDLARAGAAPDLSPRPLHVARLDLVARPDADRADLTMTCGKGGYVRAIARDLGRALGCLAHVERLRRTAAGPFAEAQAVPLAEVERLAGTPELDALLLPVQAALAGLPELPATPQGALRLRHGNPGEVLRGAAEGAEAWASFEGRALAVGHYRSGYLHPDRVFA